MCCGIKFWGFFLAAILGGLIGLAIMAMATPCYHDLVTVWTGVELPWHMDKHHFHANSTADGIEIAHTITGCISETGWPVFLTFLFVGMGTAVFIYIVAIFCCMCKGCCCHCDDRKYHRGRHRRRDSYDD
jgi:hypothetical protein